MIRRSVTLLPLAVILITLAACGPAGEPKIPAELLAIRNGTLITATGSQPIPHGLVVMDGDRIVYAGEESGYPLDAGMQVYDANGGTILPGFIDAHTHGTASPVVRRAFIIGGVTTICDLGAPLDELDQFDLALDGVDPVARGIHAGPILTAPGGLPDAVLGTNLNYEVATPQEGRAAVEFLHQQGVDQIKVYLQNETNGVAYPMLDEATLAAIVEEAHARELLVRAHVTYSSLLGMAVTAGVDTVEHVPINSTQAEQEQNPLDEAFLLRLMQSSDPLDLLLSERSPEYAAQLQAMVDAGIIMVPTLDRPYGSYFRSSTLEPQDRFMIDLILAIVGRVHATGGEIALGTDFNIGTDASAGMPIREMEMLLAAGLAPMDIIEAGTRVAAAACGQGDTLGTLEPGKLADVIVVDGDPLEDLAALGRVLLVIKQGEVAFASGDGMGPTD
jgi:imidazolonepropionase-like amidohydrolase